MTPSGRAPPPRDTGLILAGTHVSPISGGLRTTLRFNSTITEPMGIVAIVVRLPVGDSRVLDFGPMAPDAFSLVSSRVSEDGKFAIFQGTAAALKSVDFALSVTGPVVADVRGTCGVGPMALQIMPTGASVKAP